MLVIKFGENIENLAKMGCISSFSLFHYIFDILSKQAYFFSLNQFPLCLASPGTKGALGHSSKWPLSGHIWTFCQFLPNICFLTGEACSTVQHVLLSVCGVCVVVCVCVITTSTTKVV